MKNPRYDHRKDWENNLAKIRVEEGMTLKKLSRKSGISMACLVNLQSGYIPITYQQKNRSGRLKPWIKKLCDVLNATPGQLFPREVCDIKRGELIPIQEREITCGEHSFSEIEVVIERNELKNIIKRLFATLSPREEKIATLRFIKDYTLVEIAEEFDITTERIRQIECRILRKLKHPTRSRMLYSYVN